MSTRKPRPGAAAQHSLSDEDTKRAATFMLDIASALLPPGTPARAGNGETRFGRKGSLTIKADGRWYDHEAGVGGGVVLLIRHLLKPNCELREAVAWANRWLSTHQGIGSLTIESTPRPKHGRSETRNLPSVRSMRWCRSLTRLPRFT